MPDIVHDFIIAAPVNAVFNGVSTPSGLNTWWTKECSGVAGIGQVYALGFGPGYDWQAVVTRSVTNQVFELQIGESDADWKGSRVGFELEAKDKCVQVHFYHRGWPEVNQHYRTSSYCWAMYLRILKRYLENGEEVAYEKRLDV